MSRSIEGEAAKHLSADKDKKRTGGKRKVRERKWAQSKNENGEDRDDSNQLLFDNGGGDDFSDLSNEKAVSPKITAEEKNNDEEERMLRPRKRSKHAAGGSKMATKEGNTDHSIAQRAGKRKQGKAAKSVAGEKTEGKRQNNGNRRKRNRHSRLVYLQPT